MKFALITSAVLLAATAAPAQHTQRPDGAVETGQSQFAAIAEIVGMLRNDPATDWAKVNINALREHLLDMDNVTTGAEVVQVVDDLTMIFDVSGNENVAASIQRMVLAHRPMLQQATGWSVTAEKTANGAEMIITLATADERNQVTGLGFFGVMTIGAHHQQHHLLIASGGAPH